MPKTDTGSSDTPQPTVSQSPPPSTSDNSGGSTGSTDTQSQPSKIKGHTQSYSGGFSQGKIDGSVGVYDPVPACAGKTGKDAEHCGIGYKTAYVQNCKKSPDGCGDGPTTCPPGEKCGPTIPVGCQAPSNCPVPPEPPLKQCPNGQIITTGTCPPLPKQCKEFSNGTLVKCVFTKTIVHKQTVGTSTNTNDVNLFILTTCTADFNNNALNTAMAALCDSTITMMHNDGLDAQLPQVDMYLKARGLLQ
jgi:hypothetical protein